MNSDNFEISLLEGTSVKNSYITTYKWYLIPNVDDRLVIKDNKKFIVRERLLPTDDSNRVVLFGDIVSIQS